VWCKFSENLTKTFQEIVLTSPECAISSKLYSTCFQGDLETPGSQHRGQEPGVTTQNKDQDLDTWVSTLRSRTQAHNFTKIKPWHRRLKVKSLGSRMETKIKTLTPGSQHQDQDPRYTTLPRLSPDTWVSRSRPWAHKCRPWWRLKN